MEHDFERDVNPTEVLMSVFYRLRWFLHLDSIVIASEDIGEYRE